MRVPWTPRRSNQSILKEINPEYSLKGLILKLEPQYFGHLMRRANSLNKDPDAGRDGGQEAKGVTEDEMARWHHRLSGHKFEQSLRESEGQGEPGTLQSMGSQRVGHSLAPEQHQIGAEGSTSS